MTYLIDNLKQTICEIEDYLAPKLDGWEQMLYHYLFRHTILEGKDTLIVPARSIGPKIGKGRNGAAELARNNAPKKLRTLEKTGAIKILRKTREGTEVQVFVPSEISGLIPVPSEPSNIDLTSVDFFSSEENRRKIFDRDSRKCCYCLKALDQKNFTIDHIIPQGNGVDHSYKNLVAACFECNSRKHSQKADEFLRANYRAKYIDQKELSVCMEYIDNVQHGLIIPS